MSIKLICVGNIKEPFYRDAIEEYTKRLSAYTKLSIIEVKDEKTPKDSSLKEEEKIKEEEEKRILKHLSPKDFLILTDIDGKMLDSCDFADFMNDAENKNSDIVFVIGGSLGVSKRIKERADYKLSFSKFTFPHMLMRVIFLEQLYRSYKIRKNEPYHK